MSLDEFSQADQSRSIVLALLRTGFHIEAQVSPTTIVLRLRGELDMASGASLRDAIASALEANPLVLAIDLAHLTFVDSTGIRVLMGGSRRAAEAGCAFVLCAPRRPILKALQLTGLDQVMVIETETPTLD